MHCKLITMRDNAIHVSLHSDYDNDRLIIQSYIFLRTRATAVMLVRWEWGW